MLKNTQKVTLFDQLKLIVYSELEIMTRDDSQSCLVFSEEHSCMAFQSFIACIAWNDSIWGVNNSKVIAEAFIYP